MQMFLKEIFQKTLLFELNLLCVYKRLIFDNEYRSFIKKVLETIRTYCLYLSIVGCKYTRTY